MEEGLFEFYTGSGYEDFRRTFDREDTISSF